MTHLPTDHEIWFALDRHHKEIACSKMRDWFQEDPTRFSRYSIQIGDLLLDYSRNRITDETLSLLTKFAEAMSLQEKIDRLFSGKHVNVVEDRPALHTALRDQTGQPIDVDGENVAIQIAATLAKMRHFTQHIHDGTWRGVTGKPITTIVTLGIGGSFLGAMLCCQALKDFAVTTLKHHFIASADPALIRDTLEQIDPESTLFIIASKTFTTLETLTNARFLSAWMQDRLGPTVIQAHFIAVTANADPALKFGIIPDNIFPIWDWVGGRYSVWSAMGLPLMLVIGSAEFDAFLAGAFEMDQHFKQTEFSKNMPVLLALLSVWYVNFFHATAHAVVPYSYRLRSLVSYLQQMVMESNGKSTSMDGHPIEYATSPVIFGDEGSCGQHAYHQLLHQGQHFIPVDFILVGNAEDVLIASGLSQALALMVGKTQHEARDALLFAKHPSETVDYLAAHQVNAGNRPSNVLLMKQLTPKNLGALLALYEHKTFVQGVLWHINAFDQWGVELGKQLLVPILRCIQDERYTLSLD